MKSVLLIGPSSRALGRDLASALGITAIAAEVRQFPDGECCVAAQLPDDCKRVIIVQGTHPPQDRSLQQLYQLVELSRHQGAQHITCVTPYLAYARQDRRSNAGEPLSVEIVLRTLAMLGATKLITLDLHNPDVLARAPLDSVNLAAAPLLLDRARALGTEDVMLVSPDEGGRGRIEALAQRNGLEARAYTKLKDRSGRTWFSDEYAALNGRHVVVVDDLCSSGSTLLPFCKRLIEDGAKRISICITHLLAEPVRLLDLLGEQHDLVCSDSIPGAPAQVSIAPLIARSLENSFSTSEFV